MRNKKRELKSPEENEKRFSTEPSNTTTSDETEYENNLYGRERFLNTFFD